MTGWHASVALNRALCGDRTQPLCSRVYEARPSRWRSVYLIAADILFSEYGHCKRVHRDWLRLRNQ